MRAFGMWQSQNSKEGMSKGYQISELTRDILSAAAVLWLAVATAAGPRLFRLRPRLFLNLPADRQHARKAQC